MLSRILLWTAIGFSNFAFGGENTTEHRPYDAGSSLYTGEKIGRATDKCKIHVVDNYKGAVILRQSDFANVITDEIAIGVWFYQSGAEKKIECRVSKTGELKVKLARP